MQPKPHAGPCGLPCIAGGVRGREGIDAYKAGQVHGCGEPLACPRCGVLARDVLTCPACGERDPARLILDEDAHEIGCVCGCVFPISGMP